MKKVQVKLASGPARLTCWVEPKVKVGQQITLKDSDEPNRWWMILEVGPETDTSEIKRKWGQTDVPRGQTPRVVGSE